MEGITYQQIVLAHEASGLPLDDESLKVLCEELDQKQTGFITFQNFSNFMDSQDDEMMQELQRQTNEDFI